DLAPYEETPLCEMLSLTCRSAGFGRFSPTRAILRGRCRFDDLRRGRCFADTERTGSTLPFPKVGGQLPCEPQVRVPVLRGRLQLRPLVPLVEARDEQERLVATDELRRDTPVIPVELPTTAVDRHPLGPAQRRVVIARHDVRDQAHPLGPGGTVGCL